MSEMRSCQISDQECITAFEVTGQGYITAFEVLIPGLQGATAQPLILNGPALAGRASGTGGLESIGLGSNLSIVNGVLTLGIQGTVTSVSLSVPTGFDVSNSPVTGSGTLGISFSPGYSLPQTSKQAEWNTAYAERLRWDGGSGGLDAVAARSSLELGSAALSPTSAFATAAQGQLADTAVQPATLSFALASKVDTTDLRLSDAREWTASTIEQAEAESGTSTTRRAFTAQRVFQAIAAWWNGSSAKAKLDGIQAGAEVNVNADWNATSGDARILNKPAIPSGADAAPQALGTAAVGVSSDYAREDHVHAMPTAGQVGAAASEHVHGNITNAGAIGSTSGAPIITGANGVLQAGSFGTTPGTFAQGDDARFHDSVTLSASVADILNLSGQELQADDPGGDRLVFWDDSEGKLAHLQLGTNLSITGTTLNAAGGGGGSPGGTTGQLQWNSNGSFAGVANSSVDGSGNITFGARFINSLNGAASAPPVSLTGTWFTGGTTTTTTPAFLLEPTGTTSTGWSTSGTGIGVNASSSFAGSLLDLQVNGTSQLRIGSNGSFTRPLGSSFDFFNGRTVSVSLGMGNNGAVLTASGAGSLQITANNKSLLIESTKTTGVLTLESDRNINALRLFGGRPSSDVAVRPVYVTGGTAQLGAVANPSGGSVIIEGGSGAASGAANGGNVFLDGGPAFGTGIVGNVVIGATRGNLQITDARNIVLGATTGTQIGTSSTQKLAFYGAAPVTQPTSVANATDAASAVTQLNALLAHMRTLGIIAT